MAGEGVSQYEKFGPLLKFGWVLHKSNTKEVDNSSASLRSPNFDNLLPKVKEIRIAGVGGKDLPKAINGS